MDLEMTGLDPKDKILKYGNCDRLGIKLRRNDSDGESFLKN